MWRLIFVTWTALFLNSHAALTLISRETFQGVGTLTSASPGNLGTVESHSTFSKRPVGPKISGDLSATGLGWSADLHLTSANPGGFGRHSISSGVPQAGFFSNWYYIDSYNSNGTRMDVSSVNLANGNQLIRLQINPVTGTWWYNRNGIWTDTESAVAVPLRTWFELRIEWLTSGSTCSSLSVDFRVAGSSTWTSIYTTTTSFNAGDSIATVYGGALNFSGSASGFRGRYGMPSLYAMTNWSDRLTAISDVVDPSPAPRQWYCNPATGNDANDGLTPSSAWASVDKINVESAYCGLFPTTTGYANGDTLTIDTTAANLVLGSSFLNLQTRGLNVVQLGGGLSGSGELQAWKSLANASFTLTSGTTKVYQTTDTDTSAVVWENHKWMNHPTGTSLAAVQSMLESTPGSFWTDGTTLYLHPFSDTNPATDRKKYTRSFYRSGGNPAVLMNAPDLHLNGLRVRKTCIAEKSNNDPGSNYCFQSQGNAGGVSLIENCYGDYGSKHIFGFTDNDTARHFTVTNCQAEQATPYSSQTPWVDYSSFSNPGTATTTYTNCTTLSGTGQIGSTSGVARSTAGWICHNNGSTNYQFTQITFNDCQINGPLDTYGAVQVVRFNRGRCGGGILRSPDSLFFGTRIIGRAPSCEQMGGSTRVRNCLITPEGINGGNGSASAQGTLDYQGNTIDLRLTTSNVTLVALFARTAPLTLIWKNNYLIGNSGIDFALLQNGVASDSYTLSNNAYTLGPQLFLAQDYNDGSTTRNRTFAQWQALGKDSGSFTTTPAAAIAPDYHPVNPGPLIDTGINLGPLTDFAGITLFNSRNEIGAYEFVSPIQQWRRRYFGTIEATGAAADESIVSGDGLPNLLKYALNLNPHVPAVAPITLNTASGSLQLIAQTNLQATDVQFIVEATSNLSLPDSWSSVGISMEVNVAGKLQAHDQVLISDVPARFMRLRILRP